MKAAEKFVMVVDMANFSKVQRYYKAFSGAEGMTRLTNELKKILMDGCAAANVDYEKSIMTFTGDGGIFIFNDAADAHNAAYNILKVADGINNERRKDDVLESLRHFRVGIAFGELAYDDQEAPTGQVITVATRLESSGKPDNGGCSGEIRICPDTYGKLPKELQRLYGGEEPVQFKEHDGGKKSARRYRVVSRAPWETKVKQPEPTANPDFATPALLTPKARQLEKCFVISPIDKGNPRIADVFNKLLVPACNQLGLDPKRADHIQGQERLQVITENLSTAPMVIAYLGEPTSNWNDDVMIEIGYRLYNGKPMVLICDELPVKRSKNAKSFKELLPFHLVHKNIIEVPDNPKLALEVLVEEMQLTMRVAKDTEKEQKDKEVAWETVHAVVEITFKNMETDLTMSYISPEAKTLFGLDQIQTPDLEAMRKKFEERMDLQQYEAYIRERLEIFSRIRIPTMRGPETSMWQKVMKHASAVPVARVPLIFKDQQNPAAPKPKGYLPVITRYAFQNGVMHLRVLYLEVSSCLEKDPAGHWVCHF